MDVPSASWSPEITAPAEHAGTLWQGVLPDLVIHQMTHHLAWILRRHPIGVDLLSLVSGRVIAEMPSPETQKNRLWRSYQCVHVIGQVVEAMSQRMRADGIVGFTLPQGPATVLRAFLCWAGGTPIPDLPFELARDMLGELCDGIMAALPARKP